MKGKLLLFLVIVLSSKLAVCQEGVITFGLQYKPILPLKILNVSDLELSEDGLDATISPLLGVNFGAIIRRGFTKSISIESGLNYNRRNFRMNATVDDTVSGSLEFGVVNYEIPVQALFYVRLSKQFYMNVATGLSLNFRASDVGNVSEDLNFSQTTRVQNINMAYIANIGFEFRTKESGYFYLGGSLTNLFRPLGKISANSEVIGKEKSVIGNLSGNYISVDLRYFFHDKASKNKPKK